MKKLWILGAVLSLFALASCEEKGPEKAVIQISGEYKDEVISFIFTSTQTEMTYAIGVVSEEELAKMGGADALPQYAASQLADKKALVVSQIPYIHEMRDWEFRVKYHAYACQIYNGAVYGEVYLSEPVGTVAKDVYFENEPLFVASAISGNGLWICGNDSNKTSFIMNVMTGNLDYVDGDVNLYAIDNNGVAYGLADNDRAAKVENGEVIILDDSRIGSIWDITGDGRLGCGYWGSNDPLLYRDGTMNILSLEAEALTGPHPHVDPRGDLMVTSGVDMAQVYSVANNGVCAGFAQDEIWSLHFPCYWDVKGDLHVMGTDIEYDYQEDWWIYFSSAAGPVAMVSPNGKWVAYASFEKDLVLVDTETGEQKKIEDGVMAGRVTAVTDDCRVYMTGAIEGEAGSYIYSPERGIEPLGNYLDATYGEDDRHGFQGTVISVSDDGKVLLVATMTGDKQYSTSVYFF